MRVSLVGIGCLLGALCCGCADVATNSVAVTYADGYAAPGEEASLVVNTRFSLRGYVTQVAVESSPWHEPGQVLFQEREDRGFGMTLTTKTRSTLTDLWRDLFAGDPTHPQVTVKVPVPKAATERGRVPLKLKVHSTQALAAGTGQFKSEFKDEVLEVPVTVVAGGNELPIRLRDAAWHFGVALLLTATFLVVQKKAAARRVPDILQFAILVGWACALWRFGSEPASGVLGLVQSGHRAMGGVVLAAGALVACQGLAWAVRKCSQTAASSAESTYRAAA